VGGGGPIRGKRGEGKGRGTTLLPRLLHHLGEEVEREIKKGETKKRGTKGRGFRQGVLGGWNNHEGEREEGKRGER